MNKSDYIILFKLATRSRPNNALRCLDTLYAHKSENPNFKVLVTIDNDDPTITHEFLGKLRTYPNLIIHRGDHANKVEAFNSGVDSVLWDIIVCLSDDMVVIKKDFDEVIRSKFTDLNMVLHTPDGANNTLLTISILGRYAYNYDGYIYHPSYEGLYCDDEAMNVAMKRNHLIFCDTQLIQHIHPNYGQAERDLQYCRYDKTEQKDRLNYEKRKEQNFYL